MLNTQQRLSRAFFVLAGAAMAIVAARALAGDSLTDNSAAIDYADSSHVDDWTRHPVLGDPSFDSFERFANNPIHTGKPPFEWPVNGFFFPDPPSGNWFIFVGDYVKGYMGGPSRCILYRSKDKGRAWENLGVVLAGDARTFDGDGKSPGHTPDVSVVLEDGRYHMLYDWGKMSPPMGEGGLAYAWADRPEGPWHRDAEPLQRRSTQPLLAGKYNRPYAGTLIRRKSDWLILGMMDNAPFSWAMYAMKAARPQGPYSPPVLVRNVEKDYFLPPLMEGFPAFAHEGYVYAPLTAVAINRSFLLICRAPLERADDPAAWEIYRNGSAWHPEPVENEAMGLWGQAFSGQVLADGTLVAMFPCLNSHEMGTINLARRPWDRPFREHGFVLSAPNGPSLTCLRQGYGSFKIDASLTIRGNIALLWDYAAPMGPNVPTSGATLHPITLTSHRGLNLSESAWSIYEADTFGKRVTFASGILEKQESRKMSLQRDGKGNVTVQAGDKTLWSGQMTPTAGGAIGLLAATRGWVDVDQFRIAGVRESARRNYFYTDALLGAGQDPVGWTVEKSSLFRFGGGIVSRKADARVKWNVIGKSVRLFSPKGPAYAKAEVVLDGMPQAQIDLHADQPTASSPVWSADNLKGDYHALVLRVSGGAMPVDILEVRD